MKNVLGKFLAIVLLSLIGLQVLASEVVWIDVRSASEYQDGHLSGAMNIPHQEIGERIGQVVTEKDTQIKLYCGSGRRAGIALDVLEDMGYTRVSNEGGYKDLLDGKKE